MDILEMAMAAKMAGGGGTTSIIKTVNGVGPDENGNVTVEVPEGGGGGGGSVNSVNGVKPDSAGNVALKYDDLKGRPFGYVDTVILEEQSAPFAEGDMPDVVVGMFPGTDGYVAGQPYTLTLDGVAYNVVCANIGVLLGSTVDIFALGNQALTGMGEDTGEDFMLISMPDQGVTMCAFRGAAGDHTISVSGPTLKTLDPVFMGKLPEFNLYDMGLPLVNNTEVSVACPTGRLMDALAAGGAVLTMQVHVRDTSTTSSDTIKSITVCNVARHGEDGHYFYNAYVTLSPYSTLHCTISNMGVTAVMWGGFAN